MCDKAVLWFHFDLRRLLSVLGLFSVASGMRWTALSSEGSLDSVCRRVTLLQQQVHCLREQMFFVVLPTSRWWMNSLRGKTLNVKVMAHLPGVPESLYGLLMSGSLQTPSIDGHHAVTWVRDRHRVVKATLWKYNWTTAPSVATCGELGSVSLRGFHGEKNVRLSISGARTA